MDKYKAKIVPKNGLVGTFWEVYLSHNGLKYDLTQHYIFSVAQQRYELLKKRVEYLNKEVE